VATSEHIPNPASAHQGRPVAVSAKVRSRKLINQTTLTSIIMMSADVLAVLVALILASVIRYYGSSAAGIAQQPLLWTATPLSLNPGYLLLFIGALLIVCRRDGLYGPPRAHRAWEDHRRTIQACLATGLLLCGCMYVMHNTIVSRAVVAYLIVLTAIFLCVLRTFWRHVLYQRYERGMDTRNVLIVGANYVGNVIRDQITSYPHLGRSFKGFLQTDSRIAEPDLRDLSLDGMEQLKHTVRKYFIDEVIVAEGFSTATIRRLIDTAKQLDIEVLVIRGFYHDLAPNAPIQYLGDFPVVSLHPRHGRVVARLLKRLSDLVLAIPLTVAMIPLMLLIAFVVKVNSPGPVFYRSTRIGKRGRGFTCFKFRTMVVNADELKASLAAQNERDGILFKIHNDPRITRIGRLLRKFSLDELPQLLNIIRGDMSLVGPRPPIASEVELYGLRHCRRLEVLPGLTGLWQVWARQDPSFERYVALDLAYVENWSLWLDLKILLRTAQVVLRGTGS
jgi:exopolysaccharide biosynthesis polyprenyl glycosylphosphotransferase